MYWDDQEQPSIECPAGDFFACGWEHYAQVSSLAVCVNPGRAFNCYWEMPFRKRARFTMQNLSDEKIYVYYQINYTLTDVPEDAAYFHAQFRRTNPLPYKEVYTMIDGVKGRGHYVGTYMAWGVNNDGWWGEGEIKFFMDGDKEFPTICGTGTEDYFCGAYNFDPGTMDRAHPGGPGYVAVHAPPTRACRRSSSPTACTGRNSASACIAGTSWIPIRFQKDLRVTIQALGWRSARNRQYLPLQDDIASVVFWYQTLPTAPFPQLPDRDYLEVI